MNQISNSNRMQALNFPTQSEVINALKTRVKSLLGLVLPTDRITDIGNNVDQDTLNKEAETLVTNLLNKVKIIMDRGIPHPTRSLTSLFNSVSA